MIAGIAIASGVVAVLLTMAIVYAQSYEAGRADYRRAIRRALWKSQLDALAVERCIMAADEATAVEAGRHLE